MNANLGEKYLADYSRKTKPLLDSYLKEKIRETKKINKYLAELIKQTYELSKGGKRVRGSLVTLGYKAAGGKKYKAILDTSLFIELFHTGILIHDDFMDRDDFRRGVTTIHKHFEIIGKRISIKSSASHYGNSMAINAGDIAHFLSFEKLSSANFDSKVIIRALNLYSQYLVRVVYGQTIDITNTSLRYKKKKDVLNILRYKTAEYTGSMPLLVGATLAGVKNKNRLKLFNDFGLAFGWAFQIQDDILGIYGKEKKLGKPVGSDLKEGKNTLLMLHLAKHGTPEQKAFQRKILGNESVTKKDLAIMQKVLKESGSYQHTIDLGWKYVRKGKKIIPQLTEDKNIQNILDSLITYVMQRAM